MQFGIKTLELTNFCQHRHLLWEFRPGLVSIYGPNGTGKSNAINLGAYAALTNDYSRHAKNKAGCICQQAGPDEPSSVRLLCTHNDTTFEIRRSLQNPESHLLTVPGQKPMTKDGKIKEFLEETLGITRQMLDLYVFISQGEMFSFISMKDAERTKAFSRLCGTDHTEICWNLVGEAIARDRGLAAEIVDNSDELREKLGKYRRRSEVALKRLKRARRSLLDDETRTFAEREVKKYERSVELHERIEALTSEEADAKKLAVSAKKESDKYETSLKDLQEVLKDRQVILAKCRVDAVAYEERRKQLLKKKELLEELSDLETPDGVEPVVPTEYTADKLWEDLTTAKSEKSKCEHLIDNTEGTQTKGGKVKCPLCGEETAKLANKIDGARRTIPVMEKQIRALSEMLAKRRAYDEDKTQWDRDEAVRTARLKKVNEELVAMKGVKPFTNKEVEDIKRTAKLIGDVEQTEKLVAETDTYTKSALRVKERRIAEHRSKRDLREKAEEELAELVVTKESAAKAQADLDAHRATELVVQTHRANFKTFRQTVTETKEELKRLKSVMGRSRKARQWIALNERAREILHRDNLAARVHQARLEEMEEQINRDLKDFSSPFRVVAEEGLNLVAHFRNGTVMPAPGLSGGQKMLLAICYRLAVNPGIMILDEPTDGLDRENRKLAADVLTRLGERAKCKNHQIVVITHDDVLKRCSDQVIELAN